MKNCNHLNFLNKSSRFLRILFLFLPFILKTILFICSLPSTLFSFFFLIHKHILLCDILLGIVIIKHRKFGQQSLHISFFLITLNQVYYILANLKVYFYGMTLIHAYCTGTIQILLLDE